MGTQYGLEKDIVPRPAPLELISVQYIRRALSLDLVKTGFIALKGLGQSFRIIRRFKPDVVVGTGGYVAGSCALGCHPKQSAYLYSGAKCLSRNYQPTFGPLYVWNCLGICRG